ncbi:hypothetical protein SFRURICE_002551 [Spodoptera frugiperda]|nr:hypothetical protein SFRURICE_002551 [Spodoptera frugiperda]
MKLNTIIYLTKPPPIHGEVSNPQGPRRDCLVNRQVASSNTRQGVKNCGKLYMEIGSLPIIWDPYGVHCTVKLSAVMCSSAHPFGDKRRHDIFCFLSHIITYSSHINDTQN